MFYSGDELAGAAQFEGLGRRGRLAPGGSQAANLANVPQ